MLPHPFSIDKVENWTYGFVQLNLKPHGIWGKIIVSLIQKFFKDLTQ